MAWTAPKTWAVGDILTASDMNTYVRDNISYLSTPPTARIYASSGQSISNFVRTQITPTGTDFANGITAASGSLTIVTAGVYDVSAIVTYGGAAPANSNFATYIYVNGTAVRVGITTGGGPFAQGAAAVSDLIHCSAGDVLTLWTLQNTGGSYSIDSTGVPGDTSLSAEWVSD